jgi:RNA polymerase sigma-70 factor, ECF subfamily
MTNTPHHSEITKILNRVGQNKEQVLADLMPLVYSELRRIGSGMLRDERKDHTFHTTDLVHEAFLRLVTPSQRSWENRAHFFTVAATTMRRILIDEARKRNSKKRGANPIRVSLEQAAILTDETAEELLALDAALDELAKFDGKLSHIVELRFFAGLTVKEISEMHSISEKTVQRDWQAARAWLFREMNGDEKQ